jgi:hypothetical protein
VSFQGGCWRFGVDGRGTGSFETLSGRGAGALKQGFAGGPGALKQGFDRGPGASSQGFDRGPGASSQGFDRGPGASSQGFDRGPGASSQDQAGRSGCFEPDSLGGAGGGRVLVVVEGRQLCLLAPRIGGAFPPRCPGQPPPKPAARLVSGQDIVGGRPRLGLELRSKVVSACAKRLASIFGHVHVCEDPAPSGAVFLQHNVSGWHHQSPPGQALRILATPTKALGSLWVAGWDGPQDREYRKFWVTQNLSCLQFRKSMKIYKMPTCDP